MKCIKNAPLSRRNRPYQVFFSGSVPILECQKVGLLSKISYSFKFSSSASVMSVLLIYQSILVDKDSIVKYLNT